MSGPGPGSFHSCLIEQRAIRHVTPGSCRILAGQHESSGHPSTAQLLAEPRELAQGCRECCFAVTVRPRKAPMHAASVQGMASRHPRCCSSPALRDGCIVRLASFQESLQSWYIASCASACRGQQVFPLRSRSRRRRALLFEGAGWGATAPVHQPRLLKASVHDAGAVPPAGIIAIEYGKPRNA